MRDDVLNAIAEAIRSGEEEGSFEFFDKDNKCTYGSWSISIEIKEEV